jgi:hypothetical protein
MNPQNLERGAKHRAEGKTESTVATREKNASLNGRMVDDQGNSKSWRRVFVKIYKALSSNC